MFVEKFIEQNRNCVLYPLIAHTSPFVMGSGYNTQEFFGPQYDDETLIETITLISRDESVHVLTADKYPLVAAEVFGVFMRDPRRVGWRMHVFRDQAEQINTLYDTLTYEHIRSKPFAGLIKKAQAAQRAVWLLNATVWFSTYFEKDFCLQELERLKVSITRDHVDEIWETSICHVWDSFETERVEQVLKLRAEGVSYDDMAEICQYMTGSYYDVGTVLGSGT